MNKLTKRDILYCLKALGITLMGLLALGVAAWTFVSINNYYHKKDREKFLAKVARCEEFLSKGRYQHAERLALAACLRLVQKHLEHEGDKVKGFK